MSATANDLLLDAADIGNYAVTIAESMTEKQQYAVEKIVESAQLFHANVTEIADLIDSGDPSIGNVSFELRTPITAIHGFCEALMMNIYDPLTEPQWESIRQLQEAAANLGIRVDSLFDNNAYSA